MPPIAASAVVPVAASGIPAVTAPDIPLVVTPEMPPVAASGIPVTPTKDIFDGLQSLRDSLSGWITRSASNIDRFFAGNRHYQENNLTEFQMTLNRTTGYGGDRKYDFSGRLNLKLPVSEGRLRLVLETDPERNTIAAPTGPAVLPTKVAVPKSAAVALRYETPIDKAWYFRTDGGLKFPVPVQPFARARGGYSSQLGSWGVSAEESVYWFNSTGAGETTQLNLTRVLNPQLQFSAGSAIIWLNEKQNFDMRQDLTVSYTVNDRSALVYQLSAFGVSNPRNQVTDYVALIDYRYRMHEQWLYFEITPQIHYPRDRAYKSNFALSMKVEALFDDTRKRERY